MDAINHESAFQAFRRSVELAGGQSAFGRKVGMGQQRISYRLKHQLPLPGKFVIAAEEATGVPRHALRPDIFQHPLASAGTAPSHVDILPVGDRAPAVSCSRSPLLHAEPAR